MPSLAERICEEARTLADFQAPDAMDYIGYLKHKGPRDPETTPSTDVAREEWAELKKLPDALSGKCDRERCHVGVIYEPLPGNAWCWGSLPLTPTYGFQLRTLAVSVEK